MCLLVIYLSLCVCEVSVQIFAHYFIELFACFCLFVGDFLYILDMTFLKICITDIFPSLWLLKFY